IAPSQNRTLLPLVSSLLQPRKRWQYSGLPVEIRVARRLPLRKPDRFRKSFRLSSDNSHGYRSPVQCEEETDPPNHLQRCSAAGRRARQLWALAAEAGGSDGCTRGGVARPGAARSDG